MTNSAFGQQLLRNACRLAEDLEKVDDSVLYPEDIGGEPFGDSTATNDKQTESFFPSFHNEQEKLTSVTFEKACSSAAEKIYEIQLDQLQMFYDQHKAEIMNINSSVHDDFVYKAQMIGP